MLSDVVSHSEGLLPDWGDVLSYPGRRLLARGVAGSGKTGAITARFQWLVAEGVRPELIALISPSVAGAQRIRSRLESELERPYERLFVHTPPELAGIVLDGGTGEALESTLGPGERLALLLDHIDELTLTHHDFGGSATALLGGFVRRIDRLKAELVSAEDFSRWALASDERAEMEFAEVYHAHEGLLEQLGARDSGDLLRDALRKVEHRGHGFEHVLIDDAQELDLASAALARALGSRAIAVFGDPAQAPSRFRGAGEERIASFDGPDVHAVVVERSRRCPEAVAVAAGVALGAGIAGAPGDGELAFWRCSNERAQAQSVAADVERLIAREAVAAQDVVIIVPAVSREGRDVAVALEERAV
ncbi:MAG: ATP-dependent helicase, partial [Solirubrobacterales bacterium]|nr:ATP-dependent helicase [Solirubrobacterales bacterium]